MRGRFLCRFVVVSGGYTALDGRLTRFDEAFLRWTDIMIMPICCIDGDSEGSAMLVVAVLGKLCKGNNLFASLNY